MSDSDSTTKVCTGCGKELPRTLEFFYSTGRGGFFGKCKTCVLEQQQTYAKVHRDQRLAAARARYQANREAKLAMSAEHYAANREYYADIHRRWREANPDYYKRNREANPERIRIKNSNRRAAVLGADGQHTEEDVVAQLGRQRGRCFYCGTMVGDDRHVDHVVPIALGGANGPENIVVTCPKCNLQKGAKHPMDFAGILF